MKLNQAHSMGFSRGKLIASGQLGSKDFSSWSEFQNACNEVYEMHAKENAYWDVFYSFSGQPNVRKLYEHFKDGIRAGYISVWRGYKVNRGHGGTSHVSA